MGLMGIRADNCICENKKKCCEVLGFYGGEYEDDILLGYSAV
jgi:hypothetical protein